MMTPIFAFRLLIVVLISQPRLFYWYPMIEYIIFGYVIRTRRGFVSKIWLLILLIYFELTVEQTCVRINSLCFILMLREEG